MAVKIHSIERIDVNDENILGKINSHFDMK